MDAVARGELVEKGRDEWRAEARASMSAAEERVEEARAAVVGAEAEALRRKHILAFLEDPEEYRPNRVAKKPKKPAPAPAPTFTIIGALPPDKGTDAVA